MEENKSINGDAIIVSGMLLSLVYHRILGNPTSIFMMELFFAVFAFNSLLSYIVVSLSFPRNKDGTFSVTREKKYPYIFNNFIWIINCILAGFMFCSTAIIFIWKE